MADEPIYDRCPSSE